MGSLFGSGATQLVTIRSSEYGKPGETVSVVRSRIPEYIETVIKVRNSTYDWVTVKTYPVDINSEYDDMRHAILRADKMAEMFGSIARVYDPRDGEILYESEEKAQARVAKVSKLKYSGQDSDYSGEVQGYGSMHLIPEWALYFKPTKSGRESTTGYVLWEYVQSEIDAWKRIQEGWAREREIKRELALKERMIAPIDGTEFMVGITWYRANPTTFDPYLSRWERKLSDGTWQGAYASECPLLDQLAGVKTLEYDEYVALGRERRKAAKG